MTEREIPALARFLSISASFPLTLGLRAGPGRVEGYHIDMRSKAPVPRWPERWPGSHGEPFDFLAQMALGAYERFVAGEGEHWLHFARQIGDVLVERQERDGRRRGGWIYRHELGHTFPIHPPSLSAMAQGQGASVLVRLYLATGDSRYAEAAEHALAPLALPVADGGTQAWLGGHPFPEEYPTEPPSFVLNGAIFAAWGYHDVMVALGSFGPEWAEAVDMLASNIRRWDLGYWSAYDLFPHPITNVASFAYHALHINQLRALDRLVGRPELATAADAFEGYASSPRGRARAFAAKVAFRLRVPRHPRLARLYGRPTI